MEVVGISFRRAGAEDVEALVGLVLELGYPSPLECVRARLTAIAERSAEVVLVAEEERRVVGWIHVLEFHSLSSDPCALIAGLVVADGARGRGIGRALVQRAEAWARARGLGSLRLRSGEARRAAHAFYERLGFRLAKRQLQFRKELD